MVTTSGSVWANDLRRGLGASGALPLAGLDESEVAEMALPEWWAVSWRVGRWGVGWT